jgi:hypothetical protein
LPELFQVNAEPIKNASSHALALTSRADQHVLCANAAVPAPEPHRRRCRTDRQRIGNLAVRQSAGQQDNDLPFADR